MMGRPLKDRQNPSDPILGPIFFVLSRSRDKPVFQTGIALLVSGGAVAYLLSCVAQYGPTLYGPAGFAVPVGVPLILAVAGYVMKVEDDELEDEGEEGD